jgi:hypothetical protein
VRAALLHIDMVGMGTIDMPFMMAPLFDDADADIEGMPAAERIELACAGETVVVEVELDSIVAIDIIEVEVEVEVELDIIVAMDIIEVEVLLPQLLPLHMLPLLLLGGQLLPLHIMLLLGGQLLPLHMLLLLLGGQLMPLHMLLLLLGGQLLPLHMLPLLLLGGQLLPLHMLPLSLLPLLSTMTSVVTSIEMDSESMKVIRGPATIALL